MSIQDLSGREKADEAQRTVRSLRLTTGLILFAYATSHFLNHAFGVRSIEAMQAASTILLRPWQSYPGLFALYGAFSAHGLLGLYALHRRRHLRLPAAEAWQLALGLTIPFLLIPHAAALRVGQSLYGVEFGFERLHYQFWIVSPDLALPRQMLLLLVVWIHGCIGLRSWLRAKSWYPRASPTMASLATLVPALAIVGVVNAGLDVREAVARGSIDVTRFAPGPDGESVIRIVYMISTAYLALLIAVIGLRAARDWHGKRFGAVRITYPGHRIVSVPAGFSVLEASRWAGIAHESVCGGRGRCSTCRIRVLQGADRLAAPDALELRTLRRIAAAPDVRLACQVRPANDIAVEPLVRPRSADASEAIRFDAAVGGGRELEIAAMFVDLRGSTELATGRLPYDALFLFDRYIQVVTRAIRAHGGHVTSIAGDGIMSVFSTDRQMARQALQSALDVWKGLDALNDELASELPAPLKIGIGVHVGTAVVGWISTGASQSLQFLGDTGNVAAKLESRCKDFECTLVVSAAALDAAAAAPGVLETATVNIAGRTKSMDVAVVRQRVDLERFMAELPAAQ